MFFLDFQYFHTDKNLDKVESVAMWRLASFSYAVWESYKDRYLVLQREYFHYFHTDKDLDKLKAVCLFLSVISCVVLNELAVLIFLEHLGIL